jgi:hypothetical protein
MLSLQLQINGNESDFLAVILILPYACMLILLNALAVPEAHPFVMEALTSCNRLKSKIIRKETGELIPKE